MRLGEALVELKGFGRGGLGNSGGFFERDGLGIVQLLVSLGHGGLRGGIARIGHDGGAEFIDRFAKILRRGCGPPVDAGQIEPVRLGVGGDFPLHDHAEVLLPQGIGNGLGNLLLDGKKIVRSTLVGRAPGVVAVRRVDQLDGDA